MKDIKCKDCKHWNRKITKRFKILDKNHERYGWIMDNWCWSDLPFTEIEPRHETYGECKFHSNLIDESFEYIMPICRELEEIKTDENFGCIFFE